MESNVVGQVMVLYSPDWTNTGFSFILLNVNLFRHSTLTEQRLYSYLSESLYLSVDATNKHLFKI